MYELLLYDKGYTFEKRWIFSRTLSVSEMMKVVNSTFEESRYKNNELYGDVRLQEYSCRISPLVYLDFYPIEYDDYVLEMSDV